MLSRASKRQSANSTQAAADGLESTHSTAADNIKRFLAVLHTGMSNNPNHDAASAEKTFCQQRRERPQILPLRRSSTATFTY